VAPGPTAQQGREAAAPATGPALVTGGGGFAGGHLVELLTARAAAQSAPPPLAPARAELDLCDAEAVAAAIADHRPRAVFHLAAFSSPNRSWERPREAVLPNVEMTLNLLEAVRRHSPGTAVVAVSSGQVYGDPETLPIDEDAPLRPGNPYAVSKVSGELLGRQYGAAFGLRVVNVRPFNHAGPGQDAEYVVSSIARQVAAAELAGAAEAVVTTGNPESSRDFTDVRDVVAAYVRAAALDGGDFNVCSGRSASVTELVELAGAAASLPVRHEVDPALLRAHDARAMRGSARRLADATGWRPEIPLERTLADTIAWWRSELTAGRTGD